MGVLNRLMSLYKHAPCVIPVHNFDNPEKTGLVLFLCSGNPCVLGAADHKEAILAARALNKTLRAFPCLQRKSDAQISKEARDHRSNPVV